MLSLLEVRLWVDLCILIHLPHKFSAVFNSLMGLRVLNKWPLPFTKITWFPQSESWNAAMLTCSCVHFPVGGSVVPVQHHSRQPAAGAGRHRCQTSPHDHSPARQGAYTTLFEASVTGSGRNMTKTFNVYLCRGTLELRRKQPGPSATWQ